MISMILSLSIWAKFSSSPLMKPLMNNIYDIPQTNFASCNCMPRRRNLHCKQYMQNTQDTQQDQEKYEQTHRRHQQKQYGKLTHIKKLQKFHRLASYYNCYINNFAQICSPLTDLLSNNKIFNYTSLHKEIFEEFKKALTSPPTL